MPPKGPGRRARGGAQLPDNASSRQVSSANAADQIPLEPSVQGASVAVAAPLPVMPSESGSQLSIPVGTQQGTADAASSSSSSRNSAVQQRLGSVQPGRGKAPIPKFIGRRSEAGRAEQQKVEAERRKVEQEARQREQDRKARRERRDRGGSAGRARGGYIGQREGRQSQMEKEAIASGPFSAGRAYGDAGGRQRQAAFGGSSGGSRSGRGGGGGGGGVSADGGGSIGGGRFGMFGGLSGMGSSGPVKREPGTTNGQNFKTEDGGYISSDDDETQLEERQNVESLIDLTGADEGTSNSFIPVRIKRVEQKRHPLLANADGASAASNSLNPSDLIRQGTDITDKKRGKRRSNELQITQAQPKWRGVWDESSGSDQEKGPRIKQEPSDDEDVARPATPEAVLQGTAAMSSPEARRKAKERIKRSSSSAATVEKPNFQTAEESGEWDRHQADLHLLRSELGNLHTAETVDADGDTSMRTPGADHNPRENKVYLFQFPPILPDLRPVTIKQDPEVSSIPNEVDATSPAQSANGDDATTGKETVKVEDDEGNATLPTSKTAGSSLPSGMVGKLRIHKSGKAFLDWGGTPLEVGMGTSANFLQDAIIAKVDPKAGEDDEMKTEQDTQHFGGQAMGMGQIKGKFVVTPDWGNILG